MTNMFGWIGHKADKDAQRKIIDRALNDVKGELDRVEVFTEGAISAGSQFNNYLDVYSSEECLCYVLGRAGINDSGIVNIAEDVCNSLRVDGISALANIRGNFLVAYVDRNQNEVIVATDKLGSIPLSYTLQNGILVFGVDSTLFKCVPSVDQQIDIQQIFNYLYFHVTPSPDSIYLNYHRLLPGSFLRFKNGHLDVKEYWTLTFSEPANVSFEEKKSELTSLLTKSVKSHCHNENVGTFLSGGVDSSTITGVLSNISEKPVKSYSIGFDVDGYDEMSYARLAAKHFGCEHKEYYVTPKDVFDAIPVISSIYDMPFGNSSAVPTYFCAQLAKSDGVDLLFAGDGGDELFGGNERYAKQKVFEKYERIPAFLRNGLVTPILGHGMFKNAPFPFNKANSYVLQASMPMPDRMESYNLLNRLGVESIFSHNFLSSIDCENPLHLLRSQYSAVDAKSMLNKMLGLDIKITLADNDLPKVTKMSGAAGMEVSFPLLDESLLEFSAALPQDYKLRGSYLRWFFKTALNDFLPAEIINKEKHGFGLPFGHWVNSYQPLNELVHDTLASLKQRNLIQDEFLDQLRGPLLKEHAGYYGTLIWILVILEQWLQAKQHDGFSV